MRQVNIGDMPESIRLAVLDDARERDISVSSLVTEVVARCYGVKLEQQRTQRLRDGTTGELPWVIRMPSSLTYALSLAQLNNGGRRVAKGRLIVNCLADHYGLPPESPLNRSLAQPRGANGRFTGRA